MKDVAKLTLSHMASEVLFTIWQGGHLNTPTRTTLAKVKTILGADITPAMPCSVPAALGPPPPAEAHGIHCVHSGRLATSLAEKQQMDF